MRKLLTEFIGTFFLVLVIGLVVTGGVALAPIPIGVALAVLVYMGGHVSGAHYNPAVSLAALLRSKMPSTDFVPYVVAQFLGAVAAAGMVHLITGQTFAPAPAADVGVMPPLLIEALFTFLLALVVLNTATHRAIKGNSFYGFAIGGTVMAAAFAGGGISGGAFNPAVGVGPAVMRTLISGAPIGPIWLYLIGPLLGGAAAATVFAIQERDD